MLQKLSNLLDKHQKRQFSFLLLLMIIGGFLELFSISLLLPYMSFLTNPDSIFEIPIIKTVFGILKLRSSTELFIGLTVLLIFAFIIKNIFLYFLSIVQAYFTNTNRHIVSVRLMAMLLNKPYEYYLNTSSNKIEALILSYVAQTFYLIEILLRLLTEIISAFFLIVFMFLLDWRITMGMLLILITISFVMLRLISPRSAKLGKESSLLYVEMMKAIRQSAEGINEVKVLKQESYFLNKYKASGEKNLKTDFQMSLYSGLPIRLIESICIVGILIIILSLLICGEDMTDLFTTISVMAITLIRLMPTTYRMNSCINIIQSKKAALDHLDQELHGELSLRSDSVSYSESEKTTSSFDFKNVFEVKDVTYRYPDTNKDILSHASLTVKKGEAIALIGPSGSGKTTLINLCLGLLAPQFGSVTADSMPIRSILENPKYIPLIGYIPQTIYLLDDTIGANILFGRSEYSEEDIWNALEKANLKEFVEQLPDQLRTPVGEKGIRLSGGQRQRIGIARAILGRPQILILDEATSALDIATEEAIMKSIYELKSEMTMIISTHRLSTIKNCDAIYEVTDHTIVRKEIPLEP